MIISLSHLSYKSKNLSRAELLKRCATQREGGNVSRSNQQFLPFPQCFSLFQKRLIIRTISSSSSGKVLKLDKYSEILSFGKE